MQKYILKSLSISLPAFRKLKNIKFEFADRITLIAGHNGIGKSTILGLVANGSGLTTSRHRSYTGRTFQGNLNEIIYLDYNSELADISDLPRPLLGYDLNGETFEKRCALTKRTIPKTAKRQQRLEVRVVPRNLAAEEYKINDSNIKIGDSSKVPLPTIYLGMTRMLPIGESDPEMVESDPDTSMHEEDAEFISTFINKVIGVSKAVGESGITTQGIKGTSKRSMHPVYAHSPKSISLGQDSLSSIATALASFKKLQREWDDYPGGLLVIDEIDAGFHPHAQRQLIHSIRNAAKKLRLQVIATTHSLSLIESIHPDNTSIGGKGVSPDKVIYLWDSNNPSIADLTLQQIRNDMNLVAPAPIKRKVKSRLKVYLEDAEAGLFFKTLLTRSLRSKVRVASGRGLSPLPISVGCDNLQGLPKFDPHFKTVIIAVDADATVRQVKGRPPLNIVKLPGGKNSKGKGLNPEQTLYNFVAEIVADAGSHPESYRALLDMDVTTDQLREHLLDDEIDMSKRERAKKWMKARLELIANWKLVELWLAENEPEVRRFEADLIAAAVATDKLNP